MGSHGPINGVKISGKSYRRTRSRASMVQAVNARRWKTQMAIRVSPLSQVGWMKIRMIRGWVEDEELKRIEGEGSLKRGELNPGRFILTCRGSELDAVDPRGSARSRIVREKWQGRLRLLTE